MILSKDLIKDIYYKMYFYLPKVEIECDYQKSFVSFLRKMGVKNINASLKYAFVESNSFSAEYSSEASGCDVYIENYAPVEVDFENDEEIYRATFEFIYQIYREYEKYGILRLINDYWTAHSQELLFLINRRNNIENPSMKKEVQKSLSEFNDNALRFISELIQNADDCEYGSKFNVFTMLFDKVKQEIVISYPEKGFTYADIISLSSINETNKMGNFVKATSTIGEKGRGFKSIFVYFKEVEIESAGYHFKYNVDEASMFQPIYLDKGNGVSGTKLRLKLKDSFATKAKGIASESNFDRLIKDVENFYGAEKIENLYRNNSIFFTRHFSELRIIFKGSSNSELIAVKNTHRISDVQDMEELGRSWWDRPDQQFVHECIGSMSYLCAENVSNDSIEDTFNYQKLSEKFNIDMSGIVCYLNYPKNIVESRFEHISDEQDIVQLVDTMPIIMMGINSTEHLKDTKISDFIGHMYTYLPTSLNLNIPFIFQMPFDLEDNRSCPKPDNDWNNYLLDHLWGGNESVIVKWYLNKYKKVAIKGILDYLPGGRGYSYDKIAFYIDEKYFFESLGGTNYASIAKGNINVFNETNKRNIRQTFRNIGVFDCWKSDEVVAIDKVKIVDSTIASFDINDQNLFWDAYCDENEESNRFILDSSFIECKAIIDFCKFLSISNPTLKWSTIVEDNEKHKYIERALQGYCKNGNREYVKTFTNRFLNASTWIKYFDIDDISKISTDKIEVLRKWANRLLWFSLPMVDGKNRIVCFNLENRKLMKAGKPQNDQEICHLWLYNSSNVKIDSFILNTSVYICVINSCDESEDSITDLILHDEIETYIDLYEKIDSWKNRAISDIDKINIVGTYYLLLGDYEQVQQGTLIKLISTHENCTDISECPLKDTVTDENKIEWQRLLFTTWNSGKKKFKFVLNLTYLDDDILDILNPVSENIVTSNDKLVEIMSINGRRLSDDELENCADKFKKNYLNIYVNPDYFTNVQSHNFIKMQHSNTMILRDDSYLNEAVTSESKLSMEFLRDVRQVYDKLKSNTYIIHGMDRHLAVIKGIQAYQICSLINDDNYREALGNGSVVLNELLQNFNDYIEPNTDIVIDLISTEESDVVKFVYKEKTHNEGRGNEKLLRSGFRASDILSLISVGNSTKKDKANLYSGSKGIGFKNVYRMFDVIMVDSNGYRFVLDDSYVIDVNQLYDDLVDNRINDIFHDESDAVEKALLRLKENAEKTIFTDQMKERSKFPVIQHSDLAIEKTDYFVNVNSYIGDSFTDDDLTAFQMRFRDEDKVYESFSWQLDGNYVLKLLEYNKKNEEVKGHPMVKTKSESYNYRILFLHNCHSLIINYSSGETTTLMIPPIVKNNYDYESIATTWVENENFWSNRACLSGLDLLPDKSNRYLHKNSDEEGVLQNVEVRFMKQPILEDDRHKRVIESDGLLYVTLPTEDFTGGAVHINIPALDTKQDREHIVYCEASNITTSGKWNQDIINKVFGKEGVFNKLFNSFMDLKGNEVSNYAFLYIPVSLYSMFGSKFLEFDSGLKDLRFIPCITVNGMKMRSLNEVNAAQDRIFRLKPFMYQWFDMLDSEFDIFYMSENHDIEFIYMKDENGWDLVNTYKKDKYSILRPQNKSFSDESFFQYVQAYWIYYSNSIDEKDRKEIEKNNTQYINLLCAKTGIKDHYSRWQAWKQNYRNQTSSSKLFIRNLIRATAFRFEGAHYEQGFYFTEKDIRNLINMANLEIPKTIINRYKRQLMNDGYFDYQPAYTLAKTEILNSLVELSQKKELTILNQYEVSVYTGVKSNEVGFQSDEINEERIRQEMYGLGVKRLENLLDHLPIMLIDGEFSTEERKYYVELPGNLFDANSVELTRVDEYYELLEFWKELKCIVSRANIARSDVIYELDNIDVEYPNLLPTLRHSQQYYMLLIKNPAIVGADLTNRILQYWKGQIENRVDGTTDYFNLYVHLIQKYIEYANAKEWDYSLEELELDYDILLVLNPENVLNCNEINSEEDILEINMEEDLYENNPIHYWNELEMSLTDEQRKKIASRYVNNVSTNNSVNAGIDEFLERVYMCSESPSIYSGYPINMYLKVFVDDAEAFLIFSDYTESIRKLLNNEFGIIITKAKYDPLVNLYQYNELLPLGTQQQYEYVREEVYQRLDNLRDNDELNDEEREKELDQAMLSYLALQFPLENELQLRGYGKKCAILVTNDVVELKSLNLFKYPIFGFHIAIPLYGSKCAKDVITKYAVSINVSVENKQKPKKKKRQNEKNDHFVIHNGVYSFEGIEISIRGSEVYQNRELVINILKSLQTKLENVENILKLDVEMVSKKGQKKNERIILDLTAAHRAIICYCIERYYNELLEELEG